MDKEIYVCGSQWQFMVQSVAIIEQNCTILLESYTVR